MPETLTREIILAQAAHVTHVHEPHPIGRPSLLENEQAVQVLLAAVADGNYRETACKLAGIAKQTFYNVLKRADAGEQSAIAFVDALEKAEAYAEAEMVRNVREAGKLPQFWAANMTYLERKLPEKWGKRTDDGNSPKVVVQIGVQAGDVTVRLSESPVSPSTLPTLLNDSANVR